MAKQPKRREERMRREQEAFNRVINVFLVGIAAECYLLFMYNNYSYGSASRVLFLDKLVLVLGILGLVAAAVGGVLWKKSAEGRKRTVAGWAAAVGVFFAVTSAVLKLLYPAGAMYLCVIAALLTVMGLIYNLFQREFFFSVFILGATMFALWVMGKGLGSPIWNVPVIIGAVLSLAALAAVYFFLGKVEKSEGMCPIKGCKRLLGKNANYKAMRVTLIACAAVIAVGLVLPVTTYYAMWAVGVYVFVLAAYYVTKMM